MLALFEKPYKYMRQTYLYGLYALKNHKNQNHKLIYYALKKNIFFFLTKNYNVIFHTRSAANKFSKNN